MAASTWVESVRCFAALFKQASCSTQVQQRVQQHLFLSCRDQTLAKFRQYRESKAGIGQLQTEAHT